MAYPTMKRASAGEPRARAFATRQLRVLFVIPQASCGASMIFAARQSESMEDAGILGLTFYLASRTNPGVLFSERRRLRAEIDAFKPDVVHAHFGTMTGFFCAWSCPVPVVITYRGSDLNPAPSMSQARWGLAFLLSQLAALRASRIVCVSHALMRRLWWRRERATVIPTGVDTRRFIPRARADARLELGWARNERIVLFNAGKTPEVKRLDLAEAAVAEAEKITGPIRFVVLRGETGPDVVAAMLSAANCLLLTSDYEGSPTIVQEAMACNLPVVTVDVGDVRERLAAVAPSYIVTRDPVELGRAITALTMNDVHSNGSEAAKAIALDTLRETLMDVYRTAAERK